jgi:hypothetical protein
MNRATAIAASLLLATSPVLAQKKVFRCSEGGRVVYSDSPCRDGAEVSSADTRTEAERKAALETVQREEKLGDKMKRERLAEEARAARQGVARIPYSAAEKAAAPASQPDAKAKKNARKKDKPPQA